MSYLRLVELATERSLEFRAERVRLGRDPSADIVCAAPTASVVSGLHAEIRFGSGWRLVDLASRNGTFLNGQRISGEAPLSAGDQLSLGERGPKFLVAAVSELPPTLVEEPALAATEAAASRPQSISLLDTATGRRYEVRGFRFRIGRGRECEILLPGGKDSVVSRVHAEIVVDPSGAVTLQDAGSSNGTWLNNTRVSHPVPIGLNDQLTLGRGGPVLVVDGLGAADEKRVSPLRRSIAKVRHSSTYLRAVAAEMVGASGRKLRVMGVLALVMVAALGGAVYWVYRLLSTQVADTARREETAVDSARRAQTALAQALAAARAASAPAAQLDSLRAALDSARARTAELTAAVARAQTALAAQLAQGEASRVSSQAQLDRLRKDLAAAERQAPSPGLVDSLRQAVAAAERQTATVDAKVRAVRGADFATIAERSQAAIGLVTVVLGHGYYSGTGFVISPDGYVLTNWHVVADSGGAQADSIWVTMADRHEMQNADVIAASQPHDLALLKIRSYQGPYLQSLDWTVARARQGEPAALIGFPAGSGFARAGSSPGSAVRTSMTAGIISRVTEEMIQFDGITIGGSSGSPLFNANGEVVGVHHAGLVQSPGFAFSVPLRLAVPLMPAALKAQLGLP